MEVKRQQQQNEKKKGSSLGRVRVWGAVVRSRINDILLHEVKGGAGWKREGKSIVRRHVTSEGFPSHVTQLTNYVLYRPRSIEKFHSLATVEKKKLFFLPFI